MKIADAMRVKHKAAEERERVMAAVRSTLPEWGVGPDYSRDGIHGWRCEYPDRYGPCECFETLLSDIRAAATAADAGGEE